MVSEKKFKETEIGMIPEDWDITRLGEVAEVISGYAFKSQDFLETGIPVIKIKNIAPPNVVLDDVQYVSKLLYDIKKKYQVQYNDILISMTGSNISQFASAVGKIGRVKIKNKPMLLNQRVGKIYSKNSLKYDESFLYHYISTEQTKYMLASIAGGSANQANIDPKQIKNLLLPFPPIEEQIVIGEILDLFYDEIELNYHMNNTLEQIAQALFKRWFIDFEFPDENGNPYKSIGGRMVDSELGKIPEGWEVGVLGDFCEIIMGQSPPGKTYNEDRNGIPFYQGITDFGFRFPSKRVYCTDPKRFAEKEDVLLSVRAPVGSLNIAQEKCAIGRGLSALRLKKDHGGFLYYLLLSTKPKWDIFESEGTVFGSVNKSDIYGFKTVIPSQNLIAKFNELLKPNEMKIYLNEKENNTLKEICDSLLPKLMSGKIRVEY